jgi:hypothetical protein
MRRVDWHKAALVLLGLGFAGMWWHSRHALG